MDDLLAAYRYLAAKLGHTPEMIEHDVAYIRDADDPEDRALTFLERACIVWKHRR